MTSVTAYTSQSFIVDPVNKIVYMYPKLPVLNGTIYPDGTIEIENPPAPSKNTDIDASLRQADQFRKASINGDGWNFSAPVVKNWDPKQN